MLNLKYGIQATSQQFPTAIKQIATFSKIESKLEEPEEIECTLSPDCPCDDCQSWNVVMDR